MAIGIVAAVALPLLAMLAGGSAMQGTARDRETAARLAREAGAAIRPLPDGSGHVWEPAPGVRLVLGGPGAEARLHAAFDADGAFLAEVGAGAWESGEALAGAAVHLVRVRTLPSEAAPGGASLSELEISVEQPAAAAEPSRSRERFLSRLATP